MQPANSLDFTILALDFLRLLWPHPWLDAKAQGRVGGIHRCNHLAAELGPWCLGPHGPRDLPMGRLCPPPFPIVRGLYCRPSKVGIFSPLTVVAADTSIASAHAMCKDLIFLSITSREFVEVKKGFSIDDIIVANEKSIHQQDPTTLERGWHAYFHLMGVTLEHKGVYKFLLPHTGARGSLMCEHTDAQTHTVGPN